MERTITSEVAQRLIPQRPEDGHKGTFGHLFIVAGSRGFTGAVKLTCESAARSGVGLVTAGVPRHLGDVIGAALLEPMSYMLPATEGEALSAEAIEPALEFASGKDAVVLGPGIGQQSETAQFVHEFVSRCTVPLLIDADGLNCLSSDTAILTRAQAPVVLTPHPGEMARLNGTTTSDVQADREKAAVDFAAEFRCTVVLKGKGTVIANETGDCLINETGNAGMATGGTGDVLSGIIGGLMAQGLSGFDASQLGVYLHGLAGDLAAETMTARAMVAGDVIDRIADAWWALEE